MRYVKEAEDAPERVTKPVRHGGELPGLSGRTTLAGWLCLPEMRTQTWLPPVQRPVPVHPLPPSDLRHSWDGSAS